jgi:hypothetical protein
MNKGILIALLVPAVAVAAPKKRPKKKASPPPTEEKKKEEPAEEPAATPDAGSAAPTTPTTKPGTTPTATPTTPPAGGPLTTKPGIPATSSGGTTQPGTSPQTTPPPAKEAQEPEEPKGKEVDVDSLRQEYLSLRDELFKSRARANAVASALYSTRMTIKFTWGSARYYGVGKASIRLDGATVFEDAAGAIAADDGVRFDGYVAPGRHLVTFHVEATGKDDDSFTSTTEAQITVKAVANKDLLVAAKGKDNGDIAYAWKKSERGSYGLGIDVNVKSVAQAVAGKASK